MPLPRPLPTHPKGNDLFTLSGKTCLITGGARGIGLAITQGFLEAHCSGLAITYTSSTAAIDLAAKLSIEFNVPIKAYKVDVRSKESIEQGFKDVLRDFGRIDVVVANAGVSFHYEGLEMPEEKYRDLMGTNVDGVWWTATEAGRVFRRQAEEDAKAQGEGKGRGCGKGNFILTGSVSATLVNIPQKQAVYNASKAFVVHLTKSLAVEWAEWGGRANSVSPGFIETDMIDTLPEEWKKAWLPQVPAARFCAPDELKGAYVFLASDASTYVTGTNLIVDGGYTLP